MPPINKGTNASRVLASQRHQLLQSVSGAVGIVYELPKKGVFAEHPNDHLGFSDRSIGCFIHRGNDTPVLRRFEGHVSADGRLMQPWSRTLADSSKLEH